MCLEKEEKHRITDEEAKTIIRRVCEIRNTMDIQKFDAITRNIVLKKLKEENNLSIRQIERLTGINRGIVHKA